MCAADEDQQVKTEQSQRTLPLHTRLIELGLREYVASVRAGPAHHMATRPVTVEVLAFEATLRARGGADGPRVKKLSSTRTGCARAGLRG